MTTPDLMSKEPSKILIIEQEMTIMGLTPFDFWLNSYIKDRLDRFA
jgi:hypothetical protein